MWPSGPGKGQDWGLRSRPSRWPQVGPGLASPRSLTRTRAAQGGVTPWDRSRVSPEQTLQLLAAKFKLFLTRANCRVFNTLPSTTAKRTSE